MMECILLLFIFYLIILCAGTLLDIIGRLK